MPTKTKIDSRLWLLPTLLVLAWSGYQPKDAFTWFLEVAPVLIALPFLLLSGRNFPLRRWPTVY
jgi:putative membrane protein